MFYIERFRRKRQDDLLTFMVISGCRAQSPLAEGHRVRGDRPMTGRHHRQEYGLRKRLRTASGKEPPTLRQVAEVRALGELREGDIDRPRQFTVNCRVRQSNSALRLAFVDHRLRRY
jgi:hypothetical protein